MKDNQRRKSTTHEERYYHAINRVGEPFEVFGGGTVFARKEGETWFMTASVCSANDQFDRKIGRSVARRRYFENPAARVVWVGDMTIEVAEKFLRDCMEGLLE